MKKELKSGTLLLLSMSRDSKTTDGCNDSLLHWPGIEPGSTAWEAAMLSTIPPMHVMKYLNA